MADINKPSVMDFLTSKIGGLVVGGDALIAIPPDSDGRNANLTAELKQNVEAVRSGDIIFSRTPGRFYSVVRSLVNTHYDHMVVVLNKTTVLHIGPSRVRQLSLPIILDPLRKPLVLRPTFTDDSRRERFLHECRALLGTNYDALRVYQLMFVFAVKYWVKIEIPVTPSTEDNKKWICTDAIWLRLLANSEQFRITVDELDGLDGNVLGIVSINDFIKIWGGSTVGAFQEVELPITKTSRTSANVSETEWPSSFSALLAEMMPEGIRNAYENIGPEGRIALTAFSAYMFYLLVSSYRSRRGGKSPIKRKTGKQRSKL